VQDVLQGPIKAGAAALFVVGVVILLVNPPSLSGVAGVGLVLAGALAIAAVTAWAFVAMTGRSAMSDAEFERIILRSEELARTPALRESTTGFDLLVAEAIDDLPDEFRRLLDQTPVVVSRLGAQNRAYGHYFGDTVARDDYPDRIVLYQDTLERDFGHDPERLRAEVERTLRHELAHHLGWHEEGVRGLGL
jgi:predicted Zn-dependent protease with MMP-like domain